MKGDSKPVQPSHWLEAYSGLNVEVLKSHLLEDRVVFLTGGIDDNVAEKLIIELFYLESKDPGKDIYLHINSPGGIITSGLAIHDVMQSLSCPVVTVCMGQAASMAAILLASGTKGKRLSFPYSRILIHQPLGGTQGQISDIEIEAKEMILLKARLNQMLAHHTGQSIEVIERDTDRDFYLTAVDAKKYGIIDRVIKPGEGVVHR
jgi:ATP-dependent Clp protease protease subunit